MTLGENIKKIRLENHLKQSELAEMAKISRVAIGNYERGAREPTVETLSKIAKALETTITNLVEFKETSLINSNPPIYYDSMPNQLNHFNEISKKKANDKTISVMKQKINSTDGIKNESFDLFIKLLSSLGYIDDKILPTQNYLFKKIKAQIELEMKILEEE